LWGANAAQFRQKVEIFYGQRHIQPGVPLAFLAVTIFTLG